MTTTWCPSSAADRLLLAALASRSPTLSLGVAPAAEAALLLGRRRQRTKISSASGCGRRIWPGPVDLDLEHHVGARRRISGVGVP